MCVIVGLHVEVRREFSSVLPSIVGSREWLSGSWDKCFYPLNHCQPLNLFLEKNFFFRIFFFGNFFPSLSFWSYFYLLEFVRYSCLIFPYSSSGSESVWFVLSDSHSWFGMVDFFRGWVCEHTFCEVLPQFCNWAQLATCFVSLCVWTVFGPCN